MGDPYGTVARLMVKPGHLGQLSAEQDERPWPEGGVAMYGFQTDDDPHEVYFAVVFEDEAAHKANANLLATRQEYLQMLEHLQEEPEWYDGVVLVARTS